MAKAEVYAQWIVQNSAKRGTPEFDTVAQAYQEAKRLESQAPAVEEEQPKGTTVKGLAGAATRGLAPVAGGAALGAALGAPLAGVGAIPGAVVGAAAGGLATTVGDPIVGAVNNLLGTKFTTPTQAIENLLTSVGVAKPSTTAERMVQSAASAAGSAGGMVATGQALTQLGGATTKGVGQMLAAQPAAQIAGGVGAGIGGQAAQEANLGTAGQIAGSLIGGVAGARMATPKVKVPQTTAVSDVAQAKRAGVDLMTSDVRQPETFAAKWLQSTGERIPIAGTGGMRQAQQTQRVEAVKAVLDEFGAVDSSKLSTAVMGDLAAKRGAELSKYSQAKKEVIERLSDSGQVPVNNTIGAIDKEVAKLAGMKSAEVQPVISVLSDWKNAIQGQNISNIELLRQQIGKSFTSPNLVAVRDQGEKSLSSIYGALRKDMGEFIKTSGERRDFDKWMVSNKRLADLSGDIKSGTLKSVLQRGDVTPEAVNQLLFSSKPSEVRALYSRLSPAGRSNARAAILAKASESAMTGGELSPTRFANEAAKLGSSIGVFFKAEDKSRVEGLVRVLNMTRRAGDAAAAPPTGAQVAIPVGAAVLTDMLGGAGAGIASAATLGGMARLYESPAVRDMLAKMPKTRPGSPEELALAKRIIATMQSLDKPTEQQTED